ncbi:MAG: ornithine carbamoyltransferase [Dehalococcoidales bacterium]|nr:ornithine carbamoyltransferase [Dehalococcoidales bacterium]
MLGKDLLSVSNLASEDIQLLLRDAADIKAGGRLSLLSGKTLAVMFQKPSLRTRVSFELAMRQLGGEAIYLSPAEVGLGERESIPDVARVLSRYVDAIAARTFSHQTLETLAAHAAVPVINALSDLEHPCQALADLLTISEKKPDLAGLTLAFIGDGNNVANSLMLASVISGLNFRIASPPGYRIREEVLSLARGYAMESGAEILLTEEPAEAATDADVIYTDVWTSMGQEAEAEERRRVFRRYQVNDELMSLAREDAILMHPLPAHRGEEVSPDVLDSPKSVVFDQAENRLHLQKALLATMLGSLEIPLPRY